MDLKKSECGWGRSQAGKLGEASCCCPKTCYPCPEGAQQVCSEAGYDMPLAHGHTLDSEEARGVMCREISQFTVACWPLSTWTIGDPEDAFLCESSAS